MEKPSFGFYPFLSRKVYTIAGAIYGAVAFILVMSVIILEKPAPLLAFICIPFLPGMLIAAIYGLPASVAAAILFEDVRVGMVVAGIIFSWICSIFGSVLDRLCARLKPQKLF
jgi:hypothetical protein